MFGKFGSNQRPEKHQTQRLLDSINFIVRSIFGQECLNNSLFRPEQIGSGISKFREGGVGSCPTFCLGNISGSSFSYKLSCLGTRLCSQPNLYRPMFLNFLEFAWVDLFCFFEVLESWQASSKEYVQQLQFFWPPLFGSSNRRVM